jgi:rRNA-processing protein FCF1
LADVNYDHEVNLQNDVAEYLSKLKKEFSFYVHLATKLIEKSTSDIITNQQSNNNSPVSASVTGVNHVDNEISTNKTESNHIGLKIVGKIDISNFEKPKRELEKGKENLYIIDTNVFVDCPDIISKIDKQYQVILSAKVIDELDYLKISLSEDQKRNVQKTLRLINESIDKRGIKMETADLNLLPNDFNKKSPDNYILSVALKFKGENPIMLTSDNGLQIKAKGLGVTTITLKDFLNQRKY